VTQQELLAIAKRFGGGATEGSTPKISVHEDARKAIFFGNFIIFAGLGIFFIWALFAPLDEGIPARGTVVVESMRKSVTHTTGGTISAIHVKENQRVKEGDLLISLASAKAQSAYDSVAQEYVGAAAKMARLTAEQVLATDIEFTDELVRFAEEIGRLDVLKAQINFFHMRRKTLAGEQAILKENIHASGSQVQGLRQQYAAKAQQYELLQQEIEAMRPLVEAGYSSRNALLELERRFAEMSSVKTELQTRAAKESSTSAELRLRQLQRQQEFLRDVDQSITETRREMLVLQEKLNDAKIDLDTKKIRAPVTGQVVALQMNTVDASISPGAKILDIVPENEALLIDVQIPVQNIASIAVGQETDVRITAFIREPQLVVPGIMLSVSTDVHDDQKPPPAMPYYKGRVAITAEGMELLKGRQLRPGMSVEVLIKTGERSFMAYVMRPLMKQLFYALKEQ
jgi:protease secretion system membrane fusion protein